MKWNNKQAALLCIIYFGIFVTFQNVNCTQDSNREDLLRRRISEYYQYFKNSEWKKTWEFLSKRIKKHMASLPGVPDSKTGPKEYYVDSMKHFLRAEKDRNQYFSLSSVEIEYKNNKAYVLMRGKCRDEDIKGETVWIHEDSNWFLDEY